MFNFSFLFIYFLQGTIYLSDARVVSYPPRNNSNDTHKYVFEIFPAGKISSNLFLHVT